MSSLLQELELSISGYSSGSLILDFLEGELVTELVFSREKTLEITAKEARKFERGVGKLINPLAAVIALQELDQLRALLTEHFAQEFALFFSQEGSSEAIGEHFARVDELLARAAAGELEPLELVG